MVADNANAYTSILDSTAWEIFTNNLTLSLICLIGTCFLGSLTAINLIYNGFIAGQIISQSISVIGISATFTNSLPHAIEFLALWLSGAYSFYLIPLFFRWVTRGDEMIFTVLKINWWLPVLIIVILFSAALAESSNMSR
jgi:uncharacterized membrane protein SpoIIM required for sporulation